MPLAKHKRKFQGLWIPVELWFSEEFSLLEKMLMIEIASLDATDKGCFASNSHFAKMFGVSRKYISFLINKLIEEKHLKSTIDKPAGNRRYLKTLSHCSGIGYPTGKGQAIPPQTDTPIPLQTERSNNTKPRKTERETTTKETAKKTKFSPGEILGLDLDIAKQKNGFMQEIERILKPRPREVNTLASVTRFLVAECQARRLSSSIFRILVEDAEEIKALRSIRQPVALFVSVVKKKTGFRKQEKVL